MAKNLTCFSVTVASAGTRVQVKATATEARMVAVQGRYANAGTIFVGNATVSSAIGWALSAREGFSLGEMNLVTSDNRIDLSSLWIDATNSGDIAIIAYIPY